MSLMITVILLVCMAGLFINILYRNIKARRWKRFALELIILLAAFLILNLRFHFLDVIQNRGIETKGPVEEKITFVFCFLCTLIGMIAQYFYKQVEEGKTKFKFELAPFLMPMFASPMVFSPLIALLKENIAGPIFTIPKLTLYFVAFQNGFFWKDQLDRQRKKVSEPSGEEQAALP